MRSLQTNDQLVNNGTIQRARQRVSKRTPKIPRVRLRPLLCINLGADALGSYPTATRVATGRWKLGLGQNNPPRKRDGRSER